MAAKQERKISAWVVTLSDVNDGENWTRVYRTEKGAKLANIGNLLDQWTSMRQGEAAEDESFDAYLARVNQLRSLLEHAGEKPSHNMYAYTLLWKLQPR
jgi:hypothetical protein